MNKKSALMTVFLVVLVDLMGFGIVLPLLPFYAAKFDASPVAIGLLFSVYSLCQLVFSPFWGGLSDRIGRKPVMLISTFGAFLSYLLFAFSQSLMLLFLSRFMAGAMGGNISTAQAYVADVTTPEERAKGMGLIGAAFGIGFTLGPAIATLLIHSKFTFLSSNPYATPGFFAAFLSFTSFVLVCLCLPEPKKVSAVNDSTRIARVGIFSLTFWRGLLRRREDAPAGRPYVLPALLFCGFLLAFGHSSLYGAFPLFCKEALSLTPEKLGLLFAWMGLIAVVIQGGLIRPLEKRFGEKRLFFIGSILMVAGLALIAFSYSEKMLYLSLGLMGVGASLNGPTLNSLLSKESDPSAIGRTLGTAQGMSALGRVVGPTWGGFIFAQSIRAPFLATALILSVTILIGYRLQD